VPVPLQVKTDNDADNEGVMMVTGGDEVRSVVPVREIEGQRRNQVNVS
jgi:hypothetical protein